MKESRRNLIQGLCLVSSVIALVLTLYFHFTTEKTVYVDSIRLVAGYKGSAKMKADFEVKAASWKSKLDTLSLELSDIIKSYESKSNDMSAKERMEAENKISFKQEEYENYRKVISESIQKEDQRVTTQVLKELSDFLKKYGEQKRYDFIMGATTMGNIVYAAKAMDITDDVLAELNAQYK